MSKKFSYKILIATLITLATFSAFSPRQALATTSSSTLSFKGLPSILLNCTGASNSISKALSSVSGKVTTTSSTKVPIVNQNNDDYNTCDKAIGRYIGKQMMDKITQDTINWINTGFKGQPLFVKDPESMFKSIVDQEIGNFASMVAFDKVRFPFGRDTALSIINYYKRGFQQNATFSLNQYISTGNYKDFYTDFNVGGMRAWNAMVLFPQNNPLGFALLSNQYLSTKTTITGGTSKIDILQKELQANNGFLSVKKCVLSKAGPTYPYSEDTSYTEAEWQTQYDTEVADLADTSVDPVGDELVARGDYLVHICAKWSTVTPGTAVAAQLTDALGTPLKSIGLADDLNKSLSAVFDALINQLAQKGLTELTKLTDIQSTTGFGGNGSQGSNGLASLYQTLSNQNTNTWNTFGTKINLYDLLIVGQDGNPATPDTLIDTQQKWVTTMGSVQTALSNLLHMEKKLDYWVPGPRPTWLDSAGKQLDDDLAKLQDPKTDPGFGFSQTDLSGITLRALQVRLGGVAAGEKIIFNSYYASVSELYDPKYFSYASDATQPWNYWKNDLAVMLSITKPELFKIPSYEETRTNNADDLDTATSALNRLAYIRTKVEPLYLALDGYTAALQANPGDTTIQQNIDATNAEIAKNVQIFKQLAPGLKSDDAITEIEPLIKLYDDNAKFVEDLTYTVKRESWSWPVARRPYLDNDMNWGETETKCWLPTSGPDRQAQFAGYSGIDGGANSLKSDVMNYYTDKYSVANGGPGAIPPNILTSINTQFSSNAISAYQTYINGTDAHQNFPEKGAGHCSLLPTGNISNSTDFPLIANFNKGGNDLAEGGQLSNGGIDLPDKKGGLQQDIGYPVWNQFSISQAGSGSSYTDPNSDPNSALRNFLCHAIPGGGACSDDSNQNGTPGQDVQGYSVFEERSDIY